MSDEVSEAIDAGHRQFCAQFRDLLALVAEHDEEQAWTSIGARSEADYLTRTLGVSFRTARSWVEMAGALERHPELGLSLAAGEISIDKLGSLLTLLDHQESAAPPPPPAPDPQPDPAADPSSDPSIDPQPAAQPQESSAQELLDLAARLSARQLAGQARRARERSRQEADARWRQRRFCVSHQADDGRLSFVGGQLYDDQAAIVWAALIEYAKASKANPETGEFDPLDVRFADALVAMANAYLRDRNRLSGHPLVLFHADARLWAGEEGWAETTDYSALAQATIDRLACSCKLGIVADDPDGAPLNMGRRIRNANWQQEAAVRRRDGGCRSCGRQHFFQSHHIRWWDRDRGPTDIANLAAQCDRCHHLLHEGRYRLEGHPDAELRLIAPDGRVVHRSYPQPQPPPTPSPPEPSPPSCDAPSQLHFT